MNRRDLLRWGVAASVGWGGSGCSSASHPAVAGDTAGGSGALPTGSRGPAGQWQAPVDGYVRALLYAGPTVLVLTLGSLAGLDATTGRKMWQMPIRSSSTGDDIAVVQGVAYLCADGGVLGIDVATGRRRWSAAGGKLDVAYNCVGGIRDGAIYMTVFNQETQHREVWCADMASGATRWTTPCPTDDDAFLTLPSTGPMLFVNGSGSGGSSFAALDITKKGAIAWSRAAAPIPDDSVVFAPDGGIVAAFASDHTVVGLDPATGTTIWQTPPLGDANSSPGFFQVFTPGGGVYCTWDGATLAAYRAGKAAERLWSAAVKGPDMTLNTEVVFNDSTLYFVGDALYAVDLKTGRTRWRHQTAGNMPLSMVTHLTAGGGACYVDSGKSVTALPAL